GFDPSVRLMLTSHPPQDGGYADNWLQRLWQAWQAALSAPPSPGGQGARVQFDAWLEANSIDTTRWGDGEYTDPAAHNYWRVWQAALSARQPVGEPVG
ncbi:hypothetical protein, partial [Enterobacter hormaechei]|uniref:hypothetical protein n=1 Tax=Enterobacter hormaechei TaxID=158836 RepID=UPI0020409853